MLKDPSTTDAQVREERSFKRATRVRFATSETSDLSMRRGLQSGSDRVLGRVADQSEYKATAAASPSRAWRERVANAHCGGVNLRRGDLSRALPVMRACRLSPPLLRKIVTQPGNTIVAVPSLSMRGRAHHSSERSGDRSSTAARPALRSTRPTSRFISTAGGRGSRASRRSARKPTL